MQHLSNWLAAVVVGVGTGLIVVYAYDRGRLPNTTPAGRKRGE